MDDQRLKIVYSALDLDPDRVNRDEVTPGDLPRLGKHITNFLCDGDAQAKADAKRRGNGANRHQRPAA